MVLVDTSVWIRFLAGREPYARRLDRLLERDRVLGHDFVYGELLIGDRGRRAPLLSAYARMRRASAVRHGDVVELARRRRLAGRGIAWIDAHLLASALVERVALWTADERLAALATAAGVGYEG